jgi:outer membrane protein
MKLQNTPASGSAAVTIGTLPCAVGFALLLASGTALGQTPTTARSGASAATPHTLADALAAAYATNPTLLTERARLRATDEDVPQALAGWRPSVTLGGSAGYVNGSTTESHVTLGENRDLLTEQATVTQPLYTGGKTAAQLHRAENSVLAERATLINTEQTVFANVINAYVTVIEDQQLVALNNSNVQVLQRQLQATNDRFRVGEITRTDVAQAEASLASAVAQQATAVGNLSASRATYLQYVGFDPENLVPPQPLALPIKSQDEATQMAQVNNPAVISAAFSNAASKDAIDVAFAALLPTVSVQGQAFRQDNPQSRAIRETGQEVLLQLSVPLYQGGGEYATIRQARQTEQQTRKTLDDQRRQATQQAANAWQNLIAARSTIISDQAAIRANEIAVDGVEREALLGSRTTLDVLNAEQTLLQARTTLVQNLAALVTDSYAVAQAIGRLTAHDLNLPVNYYDETAYYKEVRNRLIGTKDYATGQPGR